MIAGVMAFSVRSSETVHIEYLAVLPQNRKAGLYKILVSKLAEELFPGREISITTYRENDRADTGYRKELERLGFTGKELLTEFGYPTQRFVFRREDENEGKEE